MQKSNEQIQNINLARFTSDGREQLLQSHVERVAELAHDFGSDIGIGKLAKIAGLYHDFGKFTPKFQEYLRSQMSNDKKTKKVRHSVYGAKTLYEKYANYLPVAELLSNCITSHHGDLRDYIAPDGETPLLVELNEHLKDMPPLEYNDADVIELFEEVKVFVKNAPNAEFAITMLTKMIYSCLVDADRLDAYLFESGNIYESVNTDWDTILSSLNTHLKTLKSKQSITSDEMSLLRETVSTQCARSGLRERGIYQLSVPTGGGKTLSSLRFALEHVKKHNMRRVIYVIPYLSIIEQTSYAIREAIGTYNQIVLEHHSNLIPDNPELYKLHTDRWDAPIIITTQVQFLESIFSAKGSDLRKLHNMANSVIIFDEVQRVPVKCIHLFNSAMNFLHMVCNTTILLCTATQPPIDKTIHKIILSENPSITTPIEEPLRTTIINELKPTGYSFEELAEFALSKLNKSMLIIVNTKASAKQLVEELKKTDINVMHLSTSMCPAHRKKVIEEMKDKLSLTTNQHSSESKPFICVSTQLIEAGVDISFECVIRAVAGLDSIIQAAGRCNRHGEFKSIKNVYVVNIKNENLNNLPDIKIGADITQRLFNFNALDISTYYEHYYEARKNQMDFRTEDGSIHDMLTSNNQGYGAFINKGSKQKVSLRSAIRSAADAFHIISPGQIEVVVPYRNSELLLDEYINTHDLTEKRKLIRELGQYTVSLYPNLVNELHKSGALSAQIYDDYGIMVLAKGFYNIDYGVDIEGNHDFLCC
jgi:CRISPR-associated endonuclease/helicase Cas3